VNGARNLRKDFYTRVAQFRRRFTWHERSRSTRLTFSETPRQGSQSLLHVVFEYWGKIARWLVGLTSWLQFDFAAQLFSVVGDVARRCRGADAESCRQIRSSKLSKE
jgi:hypothetical protein